MIKQTWNREKLRKLKADFYKYIENTYPKITVSHAKEAWRLFKLKKGVLTGVYYD